MSDTRFEFGKNWKEYSENDLSDSRISQAREYFLRLIKKEEIEGRTFLDVGFGQGLSLALAAELGADAYGIDIDSICLEAARLTAKKIAPTWEPNVRTASILNFDPQSSFSLSKFDIVHSWGVLHHTGEMYKAIDACVDLLSEGGLLVISIYNSHWSSPFWLRIKYLYNLLPKTGRGLLIWSLYPVIATAKFLVTGKNPFDKERGMDFYRDVVDWVGGYPYEHAYPAEIEKHLKNFGLEQIRFFPAQVPTGCNEFVFKK